MKHGAHARKFFIDDRGRLTEHIYMLEKKQARKDQLVVNILTSTLEKFKDQEHYFVATGYFVKL